MDLVFKLAVPGPAVPKARARIFQRHGKIIGWTPTKTRNYEAFVKLMCLEEMQRLGLSPIMGEPVDIEIILFRAIPKSASKKKAALMRADKIRPITRPDQDNQSKAIKDALNDIVYHDDAQVVRSFVEKRYDDGEGPRIEISVSVWKPEEVHDPGDG